MNGVYNATFDNMLTIPNTYTSKYQTWQVVVYPSDGYESPFSSYPGVSDVLYIENTPPSVRNVTVYPLNPTGGDNLWVSYDFQDIDGDGPDWSSTSHRWYFYDEENDTWRYSGIDNSILSSSITRKGQYWACKIIPNDGDNYGEEVWSAAVFINNTAPEIESARIITQGGGTRITSVDNLTVERDFYDADGDLENGSVVEWYYSRNGSEWVKSPISGYTLPNTYTKRGDLWRCRIIPYDGEDFGQEYWTEAVEIENTPPAVYNVTVMPVYATSASNLIVSYTFYDYDGDPDNGTSFRWIYRDATGTYVSQYQGSSLPAEATHKGDTWWCVVTPGDGLSVGAGVMSNAIEIHNSPPEIISTVLSISTNNNNRVINMDYAYSDTDKDTITSVEIKWYVNGALFNVLDNATNTSGISLVKGQKWHVEMRVYDSMNWSEWYRSQPLVVPNRPPIIKDKVMITPSQPDSADALKPVFTSTDPDGDNITSIQIYWYRDNGHMEDYDDYTSINGSLTAKGQVWYCKVRISDGIDWSDWYESNSVFIRNSKPIFSQLQPSESNITIYETETVEFLVSSTDEDGDTISYYWYLDGRIVLYEEDVSFSLYRFKTDYDSEGEYILRLVVSDGDDIIDQTWNIYVLNTNRPPVLNVLQPEGKNASIKESERVEFLVETSDPDGNKLDVRWYLDGVIVYEGSNKYVYTADYYSSGTHNITAEVYETDGNMSSLFTWTVDVKDTPQTVDTFYGLTWDQWGILMEIVLTIGSGILAVFGIIRYRKKKSQLKYYMNMIEEIEKKYSKDVLEMEKELTRIKREIKDKFTKGEIEENHYFILEREVEDTLRDRRLSVIEQNVSYLPQNIQKDVSKVLEDGVVTQNEYYTIIQEVLSDENMRPEDKKKIKDLLATWMSMDDERKDGSDAGEIVNKGQSSEPGVASESDKSGEEEEQYEEWDSD